MTLDLHPGPGVRAVVLEIDRDDAVVWKSYDLGSSSRSDPLA